MRDEGVGSDVGSIPDAVQARELKRKVEGAIKDMKGGAYRGALAVPTDDDMDWVDDGDDDLAELADRRIVTKATKLAAMANLGDSLAEQNDALRAQLNKLKPLAKLQEENDRLQLELTAVGPPEAKEEIEILRQKIASVTGERDVLQRQTASLKASLRAERIGRMVDEDQALAANLDPCLRDPDVPGKLLEEASNVTRPCPHKFDFRECDICSGLLPPPATEQDEDA